MSLQERPWHNNLTFLYKIVNRLLPDCLQSYIEASFPDNYPLRSVSAGKLKSIPLRTKSVKEIFFSYCIDEQNKTNQKLEMQNLYINSKNQLQL